MPALDCFPQPYVIFVTSFLLSRHRLPQPIFLTICPRMELLYGPQRSSTWLVWRKRGGSGRVLFSLILLINPTWRWWTRLELAWENAWRGCCRPWARHALSMSRA